MTWLLDYTYLKDMRLPIPEVLISNINNASDEETEHGEVGYTAEVAYILH